MQKWEYMILRFEFYVMNEKAKEINSLGQVGWELVSASQSSGGSYTLFFKRQMQ